VADDVPSSWSAVLDADRRTAAVAAAREVAVRVTDPQRLEEAIVAAREQTRFPASVQWAPGAVAQGDAGLALMCAYLDRCFPDERWDIAGRDLLACAAAHAERSPPGPSLYDGTAGLGFVAWQLGRGTRYTRLSSSLDGALAPQAVALAGTLDGQQHGVAAGQFDAMSGLSGIGAYLLARRGQHVDGALERLLQTLVELTRASAAGPPRWFTPAELMFDATTAQLYPDGHLNCGMAHGIPGPLALMALAHAGGVRVRGLRDAIASIATWLCDNRADDAWGVNWPKMVALAPDASAPPAPQPSRAAWCYGSPGVARALWLAGTALEDERLMTLASEAMQAVYRRPLHERQIDSPTFCHGVAGLLHVTLRFAHDTGAAVFTAAAADLTDQLLAAYDPNGLLGFCSIEPGGNPVDHAGLLEGAPGVALVLLAAATDVEPTWDRLFLLA
jgi:hypothetical protein